MLLFVRPPFLGQGANQALQDALFLARGVADIEQLSAGDGSGDSSLPQLVRAYEDTRRGFTALLAVKSTVLGRIEALNGPLGTAFRDTFFRVMGGVGVVAHSFADAAKPRL